MSKTVSTRLSAEDVEALEAIAREEHLDRAALVRKMLLKEIQDHRLNEAAEAYRRGRTSVEAAARAAGVSVWAMVEYLVGENIQPPPESPEELKEELEASADVEV